MECGLNTYILIYRCYPHRVSWSILRRLVKYTRTNRRKISKETQFRYVHFILDGLWFVICLICYKYENLSREYDWQSKCNILILLGTQLWGKANKDWIICSKGKYQSPINIDPTSLVHDPHLTQLSTNHNKVRTHIITEKPVTYWYCLLWLC